jgi:hypothetical protein
MRRYILIFRYGGEAELSGEFESDEDRDHALYRDALYIADGVYRLNITDQGEPEIEPYSDAEIDEIVGD